jgi:hypothetical protein
MKNFFVFFMSLLFVSNAYSAAVCSSGRAKMIIGDNQTIKVTGLDQKGISSGSYSCVVVSVIPGFFSKQSTMQCAMIGNSDEIIQGWMIEGLNMFGMNSASAALYFQGNKVFEAGCVRQ